MPALGLGVSVLVCVCLRALFWFCHGSCVNRGYFLYDVISANGVSRLANIPLNNRRAGPRFGAGTKLHNVRYYLNGVIFADWRNTDSDMMPHSLSKCTRWPTLG